VIFDNCNVCAVLVIDTCVQTFWFCTHNIPVHRGTYNTQHSQEQLESEAWTVAKCQ